MRNLCFMIVLLFCLVVVGGCKSPAIIAPSHNRDSIRTELRYERDSIYIDRWHHTYTKGDTVYQVHTIYEDRWRKFEVHDTTKVVVKDTVTITNEVEKPLTNNQVFLIRSGVACWIIIALLVVAFVAWIAVKIHTIGL